MHLHRLRNLVSTVESRISLSDFHRCYSHFLTDECKPCSRFEALTQGAQLWVIFLREELVPCGVSLSSLPGNTSSRRLPMRLDRESSGYAPFEFSITGYSMQVDEKSCDTLQLGSTLNTKSTSNTNKGGRSKVRQALPSGMMYTGNLNVAQGCQPMDVHLIAFG